MWRATQSPVTGLGNQRVCPSFLLPDISDGLPLPGPPWIQGQALALLPGDKYPQGSLAPSLLSSSPMPLHCCGCHRAGYQWLPTVALPPTTNLSGDPPILEHPPPPRSLKSLKSETETAPSKSDWSLKKCDVPPTTSPQAWLDYSSLQILPHQPVTSIPSSDLPPAEHQPHRTMPLRPRLSILQSHSGPHMLFYLPRVPFP